MHRTLLLPQPGSALIQKSIATLLVGPTRAHNYRLGELEGPSLAEFARARPNLTVQAYRYSSRQELGLSDEHYQAVNHAMHETLSVYPSGYYNTGLQNLPLWDALYGAIYHLAQPIFIVQCDYWRASRSTLERTFLTELNNIGYPDKDAAMAQLIRAGSYSRAEYRLNHRRRNHITEFGYWYRQMAVGVSGRRYEESIRSVRA